MYKWTIVYNWVVIYYNHRFLYNSNIVTHTYTCDYLWPKPMLPTGLQVSEQCSGFFSIYYIWVIHTKYFSFMFSLFVIPFLSHLCLASTVENHVKCTSIQFPFWWVHGKHFLYHLLFHFHSILLIHLPNSWRWARKRSRKNGPNFLTVNNPIVICEYQYQMGMWSDDWSFDHHIWLKLPTTLY